MKLSSVVHAAIVVATTQLSSTLAAVPIAFDDTYTAIESLKRPLSILSNDISTAGANITINFNFSRIFYDFAADAGGSFSDGKSITSANPFAVTGGELFFNTFPDRRFNAVQFRPSKNFLGNTSFVYRFTEVNEDGAVIGNTGIATVTIRVTPIVLGMYHTLLD
jgi:hypothetical protein